MQGGEISAVDIDTKYGVELYRADLYNDETSIRVYGLIYSGVTLALKQTALCSNVSEETEVCTAEVYEPGSSVTKYDKKQAKLNKLLRNKLMNNCLADAIIYMGKEGEKIRTGVRYALIKAFEDSKNTEKYADKPVFLYSESLGSKILADTIVCSESDERKILEQQLSYTTHFIMAANQITLLNLGNDRVPCATHKIKKVWLNPKRTIYYDLLEFFQSSKQVNRKVKQPIREITPVIFLAYTDPNDMLSYKLSKDDVGNANFINITVSNDDTYLGLIENPYTAHTAYDKNESFIKLLWEGNLVPGK